MNDVRQMDGGPGEVRTRGFWRLIGYAALLGVVGAVAGLVFLGVIGIGASWYGDPALGWFEGPVWWVGIAALAGLVVGLLRRALKLPAKTPGLIDDLKEEHVDQKWVPAVVVVSAVSLIGGASLGPEVALGQIGGGSAAEIAKRRDLDENDAKSLTLSGMAGAFGGLFTSPLVAMALVLEIARPARERFERAFFGSLVASSVSLGLYFAIAGSLFMGLYEVPAYDFEDWHLFVGVGLGFLAAMVAICAVAVAVGMRELFARIDVPDVFKPVIGGVIFGLIGVALPLTNFTGSDQLEVLVTNAESLGLGLLLAILAGKMVAFGASAGSGFIGGPIFPILFIGGTAGLIVNQLFPGIPEGLAFAGMLAAVPGSVVSAPFSLVLLVALLTQIGSLQTAPLLIAVGTASLVIAALRTLMSVRRQDRAPVDDPRP